MKALRSLEAANELLKKGHADFAASWAYYAMFYCVEGLLLSKKLTYSKHSAVISAFGKEFVKTNIFPAKLHHYLRHAFDARAIGDYETLSFEKQEAEEVIQHACVPKYLREPLRPSGDEAGPSARQSRHAKACW